MQIESTTRMRKPDGEEPYLQDERWLLLQRVLASPGLQRATQLRNILEHITRAALLNPNVALREHEIAVEVLGRRPDFDPTTDNIVRSQMSLLRRRLETYFTEEAPDEPLKMTIPKGAYLPHFEKAPARQAALESQQLPQSVVRQQGNDDLRKSGWPLLAILVPVALSVALAFVTLRLYQARSHHADAAAERNSNAFVHLLCQKGTSVTIVLPDVSLAIMQNLLDTNLSVQDYNGPTLSEKVALQDPSVQRVLEQIRNRRLTSVNEAMVADDVKDTLARNGVTATIRFARDMHTSDFGEGNFILIGSRRSNPWTELFASQTNFRFSEAVSDHNFAYRNLSPKSGEAANYYPYQRTAGKISSYADVAFISNLTHSGYTVLINGSDYPANEAAARYFLHGRLQENLSELMQRRDVVYFEVLLGGSHNDNDAEEEFEPVAIRP